MNFQSLYFYGRRHAWLIGLSLSFLGVVGTFLAIVLSSEQAIERTELLAPNKSEIEQNKSANPIDTARSIETAKRKFEFLKDRHGSLKAFKFIDIAYPPSGGDEGVWPSQIKVFEATQDKYIEIDSLPCSDEDSILTRSDFQKGYIVVACDMHSWIFRSYFGIKEWGQNYIYIYVIFFETDRIIKQVLVTQDEVLYTSDIFMNRVDREIDIVVGGLLGKIWTETTIDNPVILNGVNPVGNIIRSDTNYRLKMRFDENWFLEAMVQEPL